MQEAEAVIEGSAEQRATTEVSSQAAAEALFVTVPATTLPNGLVVAEFKVSKYLCTVVDGAAAVLPKGVPTVEINFANSVTACLAAGGQLIRETQALALAHNIAGVASNWTGGIVGEGSLFQGLRNDTVDEAQHNNFAPIDLDERRHFTLSNGEVIYDVAGHLYTWVFDDVQGDDAGLIAKAFDAASPSIATAPAGSMEKGVGWIPPAGRDWSSHALIRGGHWNSGSRAGVFCLLGGWPGGGYDRVGFRCTK